MSALALGSLWRGCALRIVVLAGLALGAAGAAPIPAAKAAAVSMTAAQAIDAFHSDLIGAWRAADGKSYEARRKAFAPAVTGIFDADFMAKYAVGDSLDKFTPEQKKALVASFRDMMVASYASRFKDYKGQRFEVLSEGPIAQQCDRLKVRFEQIGSAPPPAECALVKSQLIRANGEKRSINYIVYRASPKSAWRIVDVLSGPASELATRRSEFSAVARNQGPSALLDTVRDKVVKLAQDKVTDTGPVIP